MSHITTTSIETAGQHPPDPAPSNLTLTNAYNNKTTTKQHLKRSSSKIQGIHRGEQMLPHCPITLVRAIPRLQAKRQRALLTTKHGGDTCKMNWSRRLLSKLNQVIVLHCPTNTDLQQQQTEKRAKDISSGITIV